MNKIVVSLFISNILVGVKGYLHLEWTPNNPAFDPSFYEDLLDPELCQDQLAFVRNNTNVAVRFIESGVRLPRGILEGNLLDFGNYFQCLGINENFGDTDITNVQGKYCTIDVPINQEFQLTNLPSLPDWLNDLYKLVDFDPTKLKANGIAFEELKRFKEVIDAGKAAANGQSRTEAGLSTDLGLTLAICIPKACTTRDWMDSLLFNVSAVGFQYKDNFCRTNDDKPWVPADYVALVVFSVIGLLTLLSTSYDIWHTFIIKSDTKTLSPLRRSFSLYTNGRRLTTFTKSPGALECLDGIRAISMMWVILGHSFSTLPNNMNLIESTLWILSIDSTWVTAAPISVDTFFMLSGLLLVYTTATKLTGMQLLKNLHLFYLHRIIRMFPLLAAAVLMQASFFYRLSDGPWFVQPAFEANKCRTYWWSTILYIQNYANTWNMCLGHTWYLAIDMHCHILSPLILFWVIGGRKRTTAWIALTAGLLCFLVSSTIYNFMNDFPSAVITATRNDRYQFYMKYYYLNTLTRASPFFVGMFFGYFLHLWREQKIKLSKFTVLLLWVCAVVLLGLGIFSSHPQKSFDWDNQAVDSLINSFSRVLWAVGLGLTVVACVHGYGGPLNWFFSLQFWKLPSRLSYGMYLFHYQIMFLTAGTAVAPIYFTPLKAMYRFVSEVTIAIVVSFIVTIFIDSPFSTIFKVLLGGGPKKSPPIQETNIHRSVSIDSTAPKEKTKNGIVVL